MKKVIPLLLISVSLLLPGCGCSTPTPYTPSVDPSLFKEMKETPNIELPTHTYKEKTFVDFPSLTPTEGLTYTLVDDDPDNKYYVVDNGNNTMVDIDHILVIPSSKDGIPVKEIHYNGFTERKYLKGLYIPSTIERIQNESFSQCGFEYVYWDAINCNDFPERNGVFYPGNDLTEQNINLVIGPNVKRIPARLMLPSMMTPNINPNVLSISFAKNSVLEEIGDYAFYGLNKVTSLDLPETVKKIGNYACYGLKISELNSSSLETIGVGAFRYNSMLQFVNLPSLKELNDYSFETCPKLKAVDIKGVKKIPFAAFKDNIELEVVKFDSVLECIDESAFEGCTKLDKIVLPTNLTKVDKCAFKNCSNATYLELNKNLQFIGDEAFSGMNNADCLVIRSTALTDLKLNNKVFNMFGKEGLEIYIDKDVTYLPNNLFYPSSVEERLPKIKTVYIYKELDLGERVFFGHEQITIIFDGAKSSFDNKTIKEGNNCFLTNMISRS